MAGRDASASRPERGERVGDREPRVAEAVDLGRAPAGAARGTPVAGRLDHRAPLEDALEVRRRHLVPERRGVDLAELGERERRRSEREARVRVRQLPAEALAPREHDRAVVERHLREVVDRVPARVRRHVRVEPELDEAEVRRRELPGGGDAAGLAVGRQLLEVRHLAHVDLRGQVPADRALERLTFLELAARQAPGAAVGIARTLPEECLERCVADLEDDRQGDLTWSGKLAPRFATHSRKLATGVTSMTGTHSRLVAFAAVVLGVAALASGCGGDDESSGATTETTPPTSSLKVGLVADAGQLNDNGFNELAFKGLKRAERELGITGRVVEAASTADYVPNMTTLARQGYDLIIGVGFAQGDAIAAAAKRFPDTSFAIVDVDQATLKGEPANVQGLLFREEQVGYLVGYLGALEARRAGAKSVSAVGGFKEPPVDRFIAGYRAGAEAAVPGTKVRWDYSQDWEDQAKCKELALNQIAAGSKVVFQVAGGCGLGALSAAKDRSVWGIGVDADQSFLGPHVLTSALKGVDSAVFLTIKALEDDDFQGGKNVVFGIDQEGVGLGTLSAKANADDVAAVEDVEKKLASGKIADIPTTVGQ